MVHRYARLLSVWNYDPISRGLKLGRSFVLSSARSPLKVVWNYDPISRVLKPEA